MQSVTDRRPSGRAKYSDLFERLLDPVFLLEQESFAILEANPAAELRFGLTSAQFQGRELNPWLESSVIEEFHRALRMARRSYHPRKVRLPWNLDHESLIHFEAVICALELDASDQEEPTASVIQVILHDVTLEVRTRAELEAISTLDEMTQLPNYRHFKSQLEREHQRVQTEGTAYAIVFCDVDHFKLFNDREGHPAGDTLLRVLASLIKAQCRTTDLPARYGGEEFVVLCRGTPAIGALVLAERVRTAIESHVFDGGAGQPLGKVTLSIGVAGFPHHGDTPENILKLADQALYQSKHSGRNRITLASDPHSP